MGTKYNSNLLHKNKNNNIFVTKFFTDKKNYSKIIKLILDTDILIKLVFKQLKEKIFCIKYFIKNFLFNFNKISILNIRIYYFKNKKHNKIMFKKYEKIILNKLKPIFKKFVNLYNYKIIFEHVYYKKNYQKLINFICRQIHERTNYLILFDQLNYKLKYNQTLQGFKLKISGLLDNSGKASSLNYSFGTINRQTFSKEIYYFEKTIFTKKGCIGLKFWIKEKKNESIAVS